MWQQNNWELNRGARAAQVRRRACKSEQCATIAKREVPRAGFTSVLIKEKRLQTFFNFGLFGGYLSSFTNRLMILIAVFDMMSITVMIIVAYMG